MRHADAPAGCLYRAAAPMVEEARQQHPGSAVPCLSVGAMLRRSHWHVCGDGRPSGPGDANVLCLGAPVCKHSGPDAWIERTRTEQGVPWHAPVIGRRRWLATWVRRRDAVRGFPTTFPLPSRAVRPFGVSEKPFWPPIDEKGALPYTASGTAHSREAVSCGPAAGGAAVKDRPRLRRAISCPCLNDRPARSAQRAYPVETLRLSPSGRSKTSKEDRHASVWVAVFRSGIRQGADR